MTAGDASLVEGIRARLSRGGSRRTALFAWLWEHQSEFTALLAEQASRTDWTAIAEELATAGIKGGKGKLPTPQMVRQTWWKVQREAKRRKPSRPALRPLPEVVTILPRPEAPPAPAAAPEAPAKPGGGSDALARLQAQLAARKTPLPKVGE